MRLRKDSTNLYVFFFNDTATTEIYTLSLHDALPISSCNRWSGIIDELRMYNRTLGEDEINQLFNMADVPFGLISHWKFEGDRKSTRLNSSHANISYAVFCLKK